MRCQNNQKAKFSHDNKSQKCILKSDSRKPSHNLLHFLYYWNDTEIEVDMMMMFGNKIRLTKKLKIVVEVQFFIFFMFIPTLIGR